MESGQAAENPYASPRCVEVQDDAESLLKATTKLYRRMGWFGIAYFSFIYPFTTIMQLSEGQFEVVPAIGGGIMCGLMLAFSVIMVKTATYLAADLDRYYRRARWIAVLAAALFFPILTVPAFLAVRRLERYRNSMIVQEPEEEAK